MVLSHESAKWTLWNGMCQADVAKCLMGVMKKHPHWTLIEEMKKDSIEKPINWTNTLAYINN